MMPSAAEWSAIGVSLGVGLAALVLVAPLGVALGWLFARRAFPGKALLEAAVMLPLVLPPVLTGYLLLVVLGRRGVIGHFLDATLGIEIIFTWKGMALAAAVMGLPLMVRTCRLAIEGVDERLEAASRTLGWSRWATFWRVTLPLAWRGVLSGAVLAFARAMGEFGATVMVASNVTGERTIALEILHLFRIPGGDPSAILRLAIASIVMSLVALLAADRLARGRRREDASP